MVGGNATFAAFPSPIPQRGSIEGDWTCSWDGRTIELYIHCLHLTRELSPHPQWKASRNTQLRTTVNVKWTCVSKSPTHRKKTANWQSNGCRFFNLTLLISLVSTVGVSCSIWSRRADERSCSSAERPEEKISDMRGLHLQKKCHQQTSDGFKQQIKQDFCLGVKGPVGILPFTVPLHLKGHF